MYVVILTETDEVLFNSDTPKHFHPLAGRPMFNYVLDLAQQLSPDLPIIVTNPAVAAGYGYVSRGDSHIVQVAANMDYWYAVSKIPTITADQNSGILVLHADMPLLQFQSLQELIKQHEISSQAITFLTTGFDDQVADESVSNNRPTTFVPFIFSRDMIDSDFIRMLKELTTVDLSMTNIVNTARQYGFGIKTQAPVDSFDLLRIQTRYDYAAAISVMKSRINNQLLRSGVTLIDPSSIYIDYEVLVGRDTIIYQNTFITGKTIIGENSHIGPNSIIDDCRIGDRCRVFASVLESAVMENDTDIGPFSHLRKGAYVCEHAHIGNYSELKNSTLGPGARMGHFSYLGDTIVGAAANIGAGTITCNFDGEDKHRTRIGDNAFIGSGTMIVAPIDIGSQAKTGAGSVVTHDIPDDTLAYGVPARLKKKEDTDDQT